MAELPKRWPLDIRPENRDDSTLKDAKLVNAYAEKRPDGEVWLFKRPGLVTQSTLSGNGYGIYNWNGDIYSVFGTTLYKNGVSHGTVDATNGVYRFDQTLGGTPRLVLGNGVTAYYTDGTTLTEITDADFPSTFVKGWAYINGTTYVMRSDAGIQGDDINTPGTWDPLNVIIAQIEPDLGKALAKQLVYAIALKQWSGEVFYDAGNATGSPLGRAEGAKFPYGCGSDDSVRRLDDRLLWLSLTRLSGYQIALLQSMKATIVSTPPVDRLIRATNTGDGIYSWGTRVGGHDLYGITLVGLNITMVYDLNEKRWYQWTDASGNYFPIADATFTLTGGALMQHATNGKIYTLDAETYNDDGSLITVDAVTSNFDGGTRFDKVLSRMAFVGDQVAGSTMQVRYNDHDYEAREWSNFRNVDMSQEYPYLDDWGTFRRRALHLRHRANTAWRMQAIDLTLKLGSI